MAFQLVIAEGAEAGREFLFEQGSVLIGRTPECDVILYDAGVSRRHARIYDEGMGFHIEDLGSSNGTLVNGSRVIKHLLHDGDAIGLGAVRFTFSASVGELPNEPAPELGASESEHTRVVKASERRRSRNRGVALLPKDVNAGDRLNLERRPTEVLPAIPRASGPRASAPRSSGPKTNGARPSAPRPSAPRASGPRASAPRPSAPKGPRPSKPPLPISLDGPPAAPQPDSSTDLKPVVTGGAAVERRVLTAADKARLRREGLTGHARLFWAEASSIHKVSVVLFAALCIGGLAAGAQRLLFPSDPVSKPPEANQLSGEPLEQSFGVGPDVMYEQVDQKAFEFEVRSPITVLVVLHYQCSNVQENEVEIAVNGVTRGFAPPDEVNTNDRHAELLLPAKSIKQNERNTILFDNVRNPPGRETWKIWNLWIEVVVLPEKDADGLKRDADERYKKGEQKWEQRDIGASNRWEAYQAFRETWLLYEALDPPDNSPRHQLAIERMNEARRELDEQCGRLLMQARAEFHQGKVEAASATLDWVEKFFPSKAHPCQYKAMAERVQLSEKLE